MGRKDCATIFLNWAVSLLGKIKLRKLSVASECRQTIHQVHITIENSVWGLEFVFLLYIWFDITIINRLALVDQQCMLTSHPYKVRYAWLICEEFWGLEAAVCTMHYTEYSVRCVIMGPTGASNYLGLGLMCGECLAFHQMRNAKFFSRYGKLQILQQNLFSFVPNSASHMFPQSPHSYGIQLL